MHSLSRFLGYTGIEIKENKSENIVSKLSYKTKSARKEDYVDSRDWFIVDATNLTVGRLASEIAKILRGKHKPSYTPHIDTGDCIIVINAEKVVFTGNKMNAKEYVRYSGYPGGQRKATPRDLIEKKPIAILENAVRGMLPKNRLGRAMFRKLKVYAGTDHPHEAQNPQELKFVNI